MIASSIINCLNCKDTILEKRFLIFLCVLFFICGIPLTTQVF